MFPEYRGRLTEGITYNSSNDTILWVDIIAGEVHRAKLSGDFTSSHEYLKFDDSRESIGAIGLTSNDNVVIVCSKFGICKGNFADGSIEYILKYNHDEAQQKRLRSNDGIVDPWGHLWIGVMNDFPITKEEGVSPEGRLYRINCHDLTIETMAEDCYIANGLAFSEDGKTFYWTDSLTFTIWKFDYDYTSNKLSNKRKHICTKDEFNLESPEPDGLTMTKDEEIYTAVFSSSSVAHFDKDSKLIEKIILPAERITCATTGGKENNELFITTGNLKLDDFSHEVSAEDKEGDLGGFLFHLKFDKPLNGQLKNIWGGKL